MTMPPIGSSHASAVGTLTELLVDRLKVLSIVYAQNPIALSDSAPHPDLPRLRPGLNRYRPSLPLPDDILCVTKVSDTRLGYGLGAKSPLYAENRSRGLWVVGVDAGHLHVFRRPNGRAFDTVFQLDRGEVIVPQSRTASGGHIGANRNGRQGWRSHGPPARTAP